MGVLGMGRMACDGGGFGRRGVSGKALWGPLAAAAAWARNPISAQARCGMGPISGAKPVSGEAIPDRLPETGSVGPLRGFVGAV
ncbi:hypothetical protein GCM10009802_04810 [Streptomyces synnematoformans]|uniref:Uncharacterized protein n=1 Tax=Streptomyces synnematoformans TaxID=415721 RepID=A0ABN2XDM5_9ACTN